jgi:16S rRNA (guanine527-N7)-methyltransferase
MTADGGRGRDRVRPAHLRSPSVQPADLAVDRAGALALTPVSRETRDRLDRFVALLLDWQQRINLIAASTEATVWTRHVADSLQLIDLAPSAKVWADFGSGGGFPGLVIASALADVAGAQVHLVERSAKKAAFLREAARVTGAPAEIHAMSAAEFVAQAPGGIEAVTARAVAPLADLLAVVHPLLIRGAIGLFPKGQAVEAELTEAAKCWNIQSTLVPSRTDPKGRIVVVRGVEPVADRRKSR